MSGRPARSISTWIRCWPWFRAGTSRSDLGRSRLIRSDAHELLAEIGALQKSHERRRSAVETFSDELAMLEFAFAQPLRHVTQEVGVTRGEIADDEAADRQAFGQYRAHHRRRPFRRAGFGVVVMRDQAAYRHPRECVELRKHRLEHRAADILEIDVDALGTSLFQFGRQMRIAMIEAVIEAEFASDVIAFVLAARDADGAGALDFRDLPDRRADRAGCRRYHHGLAGLRLSDIEQTRGGGHGGEP